MPLTRGLMARGGGLIDYNTFINDAVACSFGDADGADSAVGGVSGNLIGNVVVGDKASQTITYNSSTKQWVLGAGLAFGQGFVIANTKPGANVIVQNNIFTQDSQNAKPAITLTMATGTSNPSSAVGINDLTIENNIANGFRIGIQTDGRFVAGGSGLYALNDLKVLNNDFINNSTQEVRHDGVFSSAQETWSGNRYYDTVLSKNSWVTLGQGSGTGVAVAFATWVANYDIGAVTLSTLPYANPSVSIASYNVTLGGSSSVSAFMAKADLLSIYNYQPQYMATSTVPYIDAGFNVSGGAVFVNGPGTPATASAVTTNLTTSSLGSTAFYQFTVNYTDGALLNLSSLGNLNLLVDGPNGFSEYATYVSAGTSSVDTGGYQHTAVTYKITPPSGIWAKGQDGTYTIELLPNQITDNEGNIAADAIIGSFNVNFTAPTALATATNVSTAGGSTYTFSVVYADPAGIDTSTLGNGQVTVTGPNGYSRFATLTGQSTASNGSVTANYSVATPGGSLGKHRQRRVLDQHGRQRRIRFGRELRGRWCARHVCRRDWHHSNVQHCVHRRDCLQRRGRHRHIQLPRQHAHRRYRIPGPDGHRNTGHRRCQHHHRRQRQLLLYRPRGRSIYGDRSCPPPVLR